VNERFPRLDQKEVVLPIRCVCCVCVCVCLCVYIYIYIYKTSPSHLSHHPIAEFRVLGKVVPQQYATSYFSLVSWNGVRLSPLHMSNIAWPVLPPPDNRWWVWNSRWNENWQVKLKCSEETFHNATSSIINPTWLGQGRRGGKLPNRLSYATAETQIDATFSHYDVSLRWGRICQCCSCSLWNFWFVHRICSDIRGVSDTLCTGK
jgi:hypothetical protein